MNSQEIIQMLAGIGAIITNSHIVYTSGRHGSAYINKDALYVHPQITFRLCEILARPYQADTVDVVAGPAVGGVILAQWVAYHLNRSRSSGETLAIYAEEESGSLRFKRGYDQFIKPGTSVVIVEDVLTTGGSARKVIEAVRALGGNVQGLSALCNRGGISPEHIGGVPLHALITLNLDSWAEEECPLCRHHVPVNTTVGKGKAFLARHQIRPE
jgi:orotate phosphoribosyltransferase